MTDWHKAGLKSWRTRRAMSAFAKVRASDKALQKAFEMSEFEKFDATVRKVLSVSHDELKKRERAWKRNRTKRKQRAEAKASRERRASVDKD